MGRAIPPLHLYALMAWTEMLPDFIRGKTVTIATYNTVKHCVPLSYIKTNAYLNGVYCFHIFYFMKFSKSICS